MSDERTEAMEKALDQADGLVTMVIKGDPKASRAALDLARSLYELRRKFPQTQTKNK